MCGAALATLSRAHCILIPAFPAGDLLTAPASVWHQVPPNDTLVRAPSFEDVLRTGSGALPRSTHLRHATGRSTRSQASSSSSFVVASDVVVSMPCIVSGSSFATSFEYDDDPGLCALALLAIIRTVCGSCGAPAAQANALARRAFLSSSLRCRQPPVGCSGAGLSVSLFPLSHSLVCRSIRLCH